jgi:hypothetical protein
MAAPSRRCRQRCPATAAALSPGSSSRSLNGGAGSSTGADYVILIVTPTAIPTVAAVAKAMLTKVKTLV